MHPLLLSIIIPNYNHAVYLKQRIDSVLNQSFQDFEVIILDDCSPDHSREVIEEYRNHPKVSHIVYNDNNSGSTFKQWQKGIELAKGEWIWIAESDDWADTDFLKDLAPYLKDDVSFAYVRNSIVDSDSNIIFEESETETSWIEGKIFTEQYLIPFTAVKNASSAVFRKQYAAQISNYYMQFRLCGDWIFWAELSRLGKVVKYGKRLNYFRKHNNNVRSSTLRSEFGIIEEIQTLQYFFSSRFINGAQFEQSLQYHYSRFFTNRKEYSKVVKKRIEQCFSANGLKASYKAKIFAGFYFKKLISR